MVRLSLPRTRRNRLIALGAVVAVLLAAGVYWFRPTDDGVRTTQEIVHVPRSPGSDAHIAIDTTLFVPDSATASDPAPAVLLAHGFGNDKTNTARQARGLARRGLVALTYSARGFGRSGGTISMDDPDYEVADASHLVDRLGKLDEVKMDAPNDPRVGVTGSSYGGALALLLAGTDDRIDTIAPVITYNDLAQALLPNSASTAEVPTDSPATSAAAPNGVFKKEWAGILFAAASAHADESSPIANPPDENTAHPECGRFSTHICRAYRDIARDGKADSDTRRLLHKISPKSVTANIDIPTLLVQGSHDTLFGLEQADANARQISDAGGDVKVVWFPGGHGSTPPGGRVNTIMSDWLVHHLTGEGEPATQGFSYGLEGPVRGSDEQEPNTRWRAAPHYPGTGDAAPSRRERLRLHGENQRIVRPPGAVPSAVSGLPLLNEILGGSSDVTDRISIDPPGQSAGFTTGPLDSDVLVTGSSQVTLDIAGTDAAPHGSGNLLFAKLYDVDEDGNTKLPATAVSPFRVPELPGDGSPTEVTVTLPGIAHSFDQGHAMRLVIGATDRAYTVPDQPAEYQVSLADNDLAAPTVTGESVGQHPPLGRILGIVGVVVAGALAAALLRLRRPRGHRRGIPVDHAAADTPLLIEGLTKSYRGGITAVDDLSFAVRPGQVLGLLGPNGAGKTTTLRMLLGLVHPTGGEIKVFGHRVRPGAPVLSRIGAFVEGAGFLPHLSGMDNLRLFWASTGRAAEAAHLEQVLEIAGLGDAVHRRVATYSQGMRQRLAIAQAMLGLPDLLVLDEPTNGLDPPQIHQMREVLRQYAATGRTVVISSHLLAEVEQTCTDVVVMHHGALVTSGPVDDVVSAGGAAQFRVDHPDTAIGTLRDELGITTVEQDGDVVYAELGDTPPSTAVAALVRAGVAVAQAGPRRRLEDAFLQLVGEGSSSDQ